MENNMKKSRAIELVCICFLFAAMIISYAYLIRTNRWERFAHKCEVYAFLKAEVMYGKLPPNTAKVSKCFERFVGYRAVFCGKVYFITGTTGHNPFHPEHIYFSGNESVRIYGERFIPIFVAGSIEDKIEEEK